MDVVIIAQYLRNIEELKGNNSRFIWQIYYQKKRILM